MLTSAYKWFLLAFLVGNLAMCTATDESENDSPSFGSERVVFQTSFGDIEFGFFPKVAPVTVNHIATLCRLGAYNDNHFFRVDAGFVAQVADVMGGRRGRMNPKQQALADKSIPGEFSAVKHVRGILSMGRYDDPNSAQSSFSVLLGDAPHLDGQYAVFGKVTSGWETLTALEGVQTKKEGIFVMPLERISIFSTYVYDLVAVPATVRDDVAMCQLRSRKLEKRLEAMAGNLEEVRRKCLPG